MKFLSLIAVTLLSLLILVGCKEGKAVTTSVPVAPKVHRNWVSIPALPIIQDAVFSLSPTFDGRRNPVLMSQVCGLARGELKQEQVNEFLRKNSVVVERVPPQGAPLSLLVNGDKTGQITACAAFLATGVLSAVDTGEFMTLTPAPQDSASTSKPLDKGTTTDKGKTAKAIVEVAPTPAAPVLKVDPASLSLVLPVKLALARANADVFALIAAELQRRPGLNVSDYRSQARLLFAKLAPVYLTRIKAQMPQAGTHYRLLRMDPDQFAFSSTEASLFEFGGDGLTLRQNGMVWYGQGKLLGQEYRLRVAYFDPSVDALLAPEKR